MNVCKLISINNFIGSGYELRKLGSIPSGKKNNIFRFIASRLVLERPRPSCKEHLVRDVGHLVKHIYASHGSHMN